MKHAADRKSAESGTQRRKATFRWHTPHISRARGAECYQCFAGTSSHQLHGRTLYQTKRCYATQDHDGTSHQCKIFESHTNRDIGSKSTRASRHVLRNLSRATNASCNRPYNSILLKSGATSHSRISAPCTTLRSGYARQDIIDTHRVDTKHWEKKNLHSIVTSYTTWLIGHVNGLEFVARAT
jgi:hypothetical protein